MSSAALFVLPSRVEPFGIVVLDGDLANSTRADIFAINAVKGQYLGEGGGQEVQNALFLDAERAELGERVGARVYEDLRQRNDPETSTTTARSFRQFVAPPPVNRS